jgi:hypothetical protein
MTNIRYMRIGRISLTLVLVCLVVERTASLLLNLIQQKALAQTPLIRERPLDQETETMTNKEKLADELETRPDVLQTRKKYEWLGWPIAILAVWLLFVALWPFNLVMANNPDCGSSATQELVVQVVNEHPELTFGSHGVGSMAAANSTILTRLGYSRYWEILERAKKETTFTLDTIRTNSRNPDTKAVSCTANLNARFEDGTAHQELKYTVEKTSDGKLYATLHGL